VVAQIPPASSLGRYVDLSLADLEAHDGGSREGPGERRFCCPLPACRDKSRDAAHRSLSLNTATGWWVCYRCDARGKLTEQWEARDSRTARRAGALRAYAVHDDPRRGASATAAHLPEMLAGCVALASTPGERYLTGRGIPLEAASTSGVWFAPRWFDGRPAVVFPCHDRAGDLVAANGRYIDACTGHDGRPLPKTKTCGDLKLGVFATPGAWEHTPAVLVEGPADALALHACGLPAVALVEARAPYWVPRRLFGRRVAVALDADETGDERSAELLAKLLQFGADAFRWRPPATEGVKDWADLATPDSGQAGWLPALVAALLGQAETAPEPTSSPITLRRAQAEWEAALLGTPEGELAHRFYRLVRAAVIATDAGEDDDVGPYLDRVGVATEDLAERLAMLRAGERMIAQSSTSCGRTGEDGAT
jgi:hypothetical protein